MFSFLLQYLTSINTSVNGLGMKGLNVFLHIPKTGGTAIRTFFQKCPGFTFPLHSVVAKNCESNKYYAVIRHPYDRLFSSFTYYKYGSLRYNRLKRIATNMTFLTFLQGLSNKSSHDHRESVSITTQRRKHTPWVWSVHFQDQYSWFRNCARQVHILCHSERLLEVVANLTSCKHLPFRNVNPTLPSNESKVRWDHLDESLKKFVRTKYKHDFEWFESRCPCSSDILPLTVVRPRV